jgi:hypothetical protein
MEDVLKLLIISVYYWKIKNFWWIIKKEELNSWKDKYLDYVDKNAFLKVLQKLESLKI